MASNSNTKKRASPLGSSFDSFLDEQGLYEEATLAATKRVLADQIRQAMEKERLSKTEMARRMRTSRSALERLIDPHNENVTLQTLDKAARAIGRRLSVALV
ncbi:MAG: XRE family transcriptional regulator [Phycisphaeraceae bacterium]|nr:XRE family transcriptional regulator [Phycisphaeraceae bacterium]